MSGSDIVLPLRIGARTVWTLRRRLVRRRLSLADCLAVTPARLPKLAAGDHGYLVTGLPEAELTALAARHPRLRRFVRQRYRRSYASLETGFEAYLATFSARSRSTLKRKVRKLAERSGGALDVRCYRSAEEISSFHAEARTVSATTYQERLLDAGLPAGAAALDSMRALAARDSVRAWLLFVDRQPIAYLYAPAEGDILTYAYLGYRPEYADLSPGSVLQFEAMRQLMAERRFLLFDFTEGEGQHKRLFATDGFDCVDLLLLSPGLVNLVIGHALNGFDRGVAIIRRSLAGLGGGKFIRALRR